MKDTKGIDTTKGESLRAGESLDTCLTEQDGPKRTSMQRAEYPYTQIVQGDLVYDEQGVILQDQREERSVLEILSRCGDAPGKYLYEGRVAVSPDDYFARLREVFVDGVVDETLAKAVPADHPVLIGWGDTLESRAGLVEGLLRDENPRLRFAYSCPDDVMRAHILRVSERFGFAPYYQNPEEKLDLVYGDARLGVWLMYMGDSTVERRLEDKVNRGCGVLSLWTTGGPDYSRAQQLQLVQEFYEALCDGPATEVVFQRHCHAPFVLHHRRQE